MELVSTANELVLKENWHTILAILKGFRNGAVYGAKIRFPHALVMTFLFREASLKQKLRDIFQATYTHSKNLAVFVLIYKSLMALQKTLNDGKELSAHSFFSGLVGGYFVFGQYSNVNYQIVLYLFSRIAIGLAKMLVKRRVITFSTETGEAPPSTYPIFAALVWGIVMWLFRHDRDTLQPSLQASMQYLYNDSERWTGLRNWIWHNK